MSLLNLLLEALLLARLPEVAFATVASDVLQQSHSRCS